MKNGFTISLDGAMGTELQARGLKPGETPEDWNIERPEDVAAVHRAYVGAGADTIVANTFGANPLKYHGRYSPGEVIAAALRIAREAGEGALAALDIGPVGRLLAPAGELGFDEAYDAFAQTVRLGAAAGADLVFIETMSDTRELKAAVLAAKENCPLPVYASVALDASGKLLTGADVECVAALLESLGVDAYGFNCGLGPDLMLPYVERLAAVSTKRLLVKPNAGLPKTVEGRAVFTVTPDEFARQIVSLAAAGASITGGCCGTTPQHIERANEALSRGVTRTGRTRPAQTLVSSGTMSLALKSGEGLIIGERINPTGKKLLKEAYKNGDTAYILREAVRQVEDGAKILDINCGVPGIDEASTLESVVEAVQGVVTVPLQIDSADPEALERALRRVNGKALINSVNGKRSSMDAVFPLVKKYGGTLVALCLDENGIPDTADGRIEIAKAILKRGAQYGLEKKDFVFDALTLAVSADASAAVVTLETVKRLTEELGVNTVLGVSNVSFGLPDRKALNNAMYSLAKKAGLSAAIANPSAIEDVADEAALDVLLGRDEGCAKWIASRALCASAGGVQATAVRSEPTLREAVKSGLRDDAFAAAGALIASGGAPMEVVQKHIVPALEEIGSGFEKGSVFLPQLLMAADAASAAFEAVRSALSSSGAGVKRGSPIVLATVKGDIHDIGKNIVKALLENYGFDVIDLGRDVDPSVIADAAEKCEAMLVGLSALMTTTLGAMDETIKAIRSRSLNCRICVGGAVVTREYADEIGADFYAKDAMRTVRYAESLLSSGYSDDSV